MKTGLAFNEYCSNELIEFGGNKLHYDAVRGALQPGALVALMGARYFFELIDFLKIFPCFIIQLCVRTKVVPENQPCSTPWPTDAHVNNSAYLFFYNRSIMMCKYSKQRELYSTAISA